MSMERFSSIHKVSGGNEEQQQETLKTYEEEFSTIKLFTDTEREKTPEEVEIIDGVIRELNDFLSTYGVKPLTLTANHTHIFSESKMSEETKEYIKNKYPNVGGYYKQNRQHVVLHEWGSLTPLHFAGQLAHELIHFLSYNSVIIKEGDEKPKIHRIGLAVQPSTENTPQIGLKYFDQLNEAVTEELVIRFYPRLRNIALLTDEYNELIETKEDQSIEDLAAMRVDEFKTPDGGTEYEAYLRRHAYPKLRKSLNKIISSIYEKQKDNFNSQEEIFTVFAKAAMTGEVKELATLIDSTLGSGTFKKIAEGNLEVAG